MSAWMFGNKLLSKLAHELVAENPMMLERCAKDKEKGYKSDAFVEDVARALYNMNRRAIVCRYGDPKRMGVQKFKFDMAYVEPWTKIRLYKNIRCFLYQCSEGDVPKSALFGIIERIGYEVSGWVIGEMKEYDASPWGA